MCAARRKSKSSQGKRRKLHPFMTDREILMSLPREVQKRLVEEVDLRDELLLSDPGAMLREDFASAVQALATAAGHLRNAELALNALEAKERDSK